jgi:hypothetical protein
VGHAGDEPTTFHPADLSNCNKYRATLGYEKIKTVFTVVDNKVVEIRITGVPAR